MKARGFEVIMFVPLKEEDESLVTCGNAILADKEMMEDDAQVVLRKLQIDDHARGRNKLVVAVCACRIEERGGSCGQGRRRLIRAGNWRKTCFQSKWSKNE
ncbi:MAG: hypothetical protein LBL45_00165 [Treponema sp.]|nr:hypothetical protein [Treponema sp.]